MMGEGPASTQHPLAVCLFQANHYQHLFHFKKSYSGAQLWPFGPLVCYRDYIERNL